MKFTNILFMFVAVILLTDNLSHALSTKQNIPNLNHNDAQTIEFKDTGFGKLLRLNDVSHIEVEDSDKEPGKEQAEEIIPDVTDAPNMSTTERARRRCVYRRYVRCFRYRSGRVRCFYRYSFDIITLWKSPKYGVKLLIEKIASFSSAGYCACLNQ